jgi:pimeloyl-ACP methyl ester carboxylesterase
VHSIFCAAEPGRVAPTCMIWLPGAYHHATDFMTAGFAEAVGARHLPLDLVLVDLEMQHFGDRAVFELLRTQLVLPARKMGVAIWLAGISIGAQFALEYAAAHPDDFEGLCLLAPYLGNRMLIAEIAAAPGLAAWEPGNLAQIDEERRIWRYIKTRDGSKPLYLGFGSDDRFAAAHQLLAAVLPAASVDIVPGGHEWRTWATLWENFLDSRFA